MAGHVFVVRSDLTRLACDAWLLPTDAFLVIEDAWRPALGDRRIDPPPGWRDGTRRVLPVDGTLPRLWLTNIAGRRAEDIGWHLDGVREWLVAAAADARQRGPAQRRGRPLLGLPVVATGAGGHADDKGEVTRRLLEMLLREAPGLDVDVVLVTWHDRAFAAAQAARRALAADLGVQRLWHGLSPVHLEAAAALAQRATAGALVLFLGAGVSVGAGMPSWSALLDDLAGDAGMAADERTALTELEFTDQARVIAGRLGPDVVSALVAERTRADRWSLQHALLAGLPAREAVTTNYDDLFERAVRDGARRPVRVLPHESAEAGEAWLLKLHGSVDHPEDIVLTRDDYMAYGARRAALAGIVQALLITRHMLFVGFGLADPNFHRIVYEVRTAARRPGGPGGTFGTALRLDAGGMAGELWKGDLDLIGFGGSAGRLEVFLDLLAHLANPGTAHLLDPAYGDLLTAGERDLAGLLADLAAQAGPDARGAPAWSAVERLLHDLGRPSPG